jgi:hypothetical protein
MPRSVLSAILIDQLRCCSSRKVDVRPILEQINLLEEGARKPVVMGAPHSASAPLWNGDYRPREPFWRSPPTLR